MPVEYRVTAQLLMHSKLKDFKAFPVIFRAAVLFNLTAVKDAFKSMREIKQPCTATLKIKFEKLL